MRKASHTPGRVLTRLARTRQPLLGSPRRGHVRESDLPDGSAGGRTNGRADAPTAAAEPRAGDQAVALPDAPLEQPEHLDARPAKPCYLGAAVHAVCRACGQPVCREQSTLCTECGSMLGYGIIPPGDRDLYHGLGEASRR